MDICSAYAIQLGVLLADKLAEKGKCESIEVEEECWNRIIPTDDVGFAVCCTSDTHDCPENQHFDFIMDAVDAALLLAADPREFQVFVGFDMSENEDEWVHVEHAAISA